MKKKLIKCCVWTFAIYESGTWTLAKNEERIINAFEKRSWRKMLKRKYDEVSQCAKGECLLLKI